MSRPRRTFRRAGGSTPARDHHGDLPASQGRVGPRLERGEGIRIELRLPVRGEREERAAEHAEEVTVLPHRAPAVWLYAAIRPRFGPGAKTATCAAAATWFFGSFLSGIAMWNLTILPLSVKEMALSLIASILAVLAGAAVYKEAP